MRRSLPFLLLKFKQNVSDLQKTYVIRFDSAMGSITWVAGLTRSFIIIIVYI